MGHEQRSFSLQHLLTALCPLHWNYELVNMSHPMREQGLGVARLWRCREMKEGVSSRGSSDQTVGRQIEQVRALIVHLLCALKIHPVVHSVYMHDGPTRCWACLILNLRVFRASYHSVAPAHSPERRFLGLPNGTAAADPGRPEASREGGPGAPARPLQSSH